MQKQVNIIRPELNISKLSNFIFPHPTTVGVKEERSYSWIQKNNDKKVNSIIEIVPVVKKDESFYFTSKTYNVFLALIHILERLKKDPYDEFEFSLREIAQIIGKEFNGRVAKEVVHELRSLNATLITWITSYKTKNKIIKRLTDMNILNHIEFLNEEKEDIKELKGEYLKGIKHVKVQFNKKIANNIRNKLTTPINHTVFKSLSCHPYIQIFYSKISLFMSSNKYKTQELSAKKILEILEIKAKRYNYKSNRKELLQNIINHLNNKEIGNNGYIINIKLTETIDGKDFKLIIATDKVKNNKYYLPTINKDNALINHLAEKIYTTLKTKLNDNDKKAIVRYCKVYPEILIERAINDYKELYSHKLSTDNPVKNPQKYFASRVHHLVHDMGYKWVKKCDTNCKYKKVVKNGS